MRLIGQCFVAASLLMPAGAWSQEPDLAVTEQADNQPYSLIVTRNMFGLVPIPPPAPTEPAVVVDPPPKITPTGIMTIFGRDQALFKVANKPKPGQPAKEDAYVLSQGERQDDIEVVKIDQPNRVITFNNHGTVQELPLVAAASSGGPAAAGGPGGGNNMLQRPGSMSPAERAVLMRRQQAVRPGMNSGVPSNPGNSGVPNNMPGFNPYGGNVNDRGIYQPQAEANPMTPEQNVMLIEAQRLKYIQENDRRAPLMPPTPITPDVLGEAAGNSQ